MIASGEDQGDSVIRIHISMVVLVVKNPPASAGDAGDVGSIPGLGRSPGEGDGNLLQYSSLPPSKRGGGSKKNKQMGPN